MSFHVCARAGNESWCQLCVCQASNFVLSPFIFLVLLTNGLYFLLIFSKLQLLDLFIRLTNLISSNLCFYFFVLHLMHSLCFMLLAV